MTTKGTKATTKGAEATTEMVGWSVFDAALGEDAFLVGVFYFAHFGDGVGDFDEGGVGVAAGKDDVQHFRAGEEGGFHFFGIEHFVADGVVDFVEDDEVVVAGEDGGFAFCPGVLDHFEIFRVGFSAADFDEAAAELAKGEVVAEGKHAVEFADVPGAFEELEHEDAHADADGADAGAEGGSGFAFAGAGVDEDEAFAGGGFRGVGHTYSLMWGWMVGL